VLEAVFGDLKQRGHREDGLAVLDRHDAPRRERETIAASIDLVDDRHARIARRRK
jgi:hypothetical protein